MSLAVVLKTARDTRLMLLLLGGAIVVFEALFVHAMAEFAEEIQDIWFKNAGITRFIEMMVGADLSQNVTPTSLMTIGFGHPLLYAFTWTMLLATCSRVIVGEMERGTADLLLSLPLSRRQIYVSVSVVWVLCGIPMSAAPLIGVWLGEILSPMSEPIDLARLTLIAVNLFAMYLTVGCATLCISSSVSRRGVAIAIVLGLLLFSFLIDFIAQFWKLFEHLSFLGLLHYYQPLPIVRDGAWPVGNMLALLAAAAVLWIAGLWRYARRDIPTV